MQDRSSFKPVAFTPHLAYCSSTDASACSKVSDEYCKRCGHHTSGVPS